MFKVFFWLMHFLFVSSIQGQSFGLGISIVSAAITFSAFRFTGLSLACVFLILALFVRLLYMRVEGHFGWLCAFVKALLEFLLLNCVILATAKDKFQDAAVVFLLCLMRQFGFQREIGAGERVRIAVSFTLTTFNVVLLILVCSAIQSFWEDENWSAFGPATHETKFYPIPTLPAKHSSGSLPFCLLRFPMGKNQLDAQDAPLSLADFGLMASLTYEPSARVEAGLAHYFPSWRIEERPEGARYIDWVRFLMFTSFDNSTTVVAVRGTLDFLDALQLVGNVFRRG